MLAGKVTPSELETMSLNDVDLMNLALDAWEAAGAAPSKGA